MKLVKLLFKITILIGIAFIVMACSKNDEIQGYMEGRFAYLSANFAGVLQQLAVQRGMFVNAGDLLFIIEKQPESDDLQAALAQVQQAQAQLKQNEANLSLAKVTYERQKALLSKKVASQADFDTAESSYLQAQAQVNNSQASLNQAQAQLEKSQWTIGKKIIHAPNAALVFDTYYLPGELVPAGQPVLSLLAANQIKAVFFVPERLLSQFKIGHFVFASCDGCVQRVSLKITYISPQAEYTPPVIYSNDRRDKLVYRIEAAPAERDAFKLHPGQPVQISRF